MNNTSNDKRKLSALSLLSLIVSMVAFGLYVLAFSDKRIIPVWMIVSIVSVIIPVIAKKVRLSKMQDGKGFEITALVIGGFAFYSVVFAATSLNIYIGYLGWIIGGIVYKKIK